MTDFAALLAPTDGQPSVPMISVTKAGMDGWLATQSERVRVAVTAQGFTAAADSMAILPGDGPAEWLVAVGVAEGQLGPWALAAAADKLPAGRYALAGELGQAGLGWCLAQHKFSRYRRVEPKGARVLTTTSLGAISAAASAHCFGAGSWEYATTSVFGSYIPTQYPPPGPGQATAARSARPVAQSSPSIERAPSFARGRWRSSPAISWRCSSRRWRTAWP